ncbi:SMI1/KNR4 family protein [bacterium]|nr:SMI1/KNR4 family protein [bacterium]
MKRVLNLEKLIFRFLNEVDPLKTAAHIRKLLTINKESHQTSIIDALQIYMTKGQFPHHREHVTACLSRLDVNQIAHLETDFEKGLEDEATRYWSILGYSRCAKKRSYPKLVSVALNQNLSDEERAHAIQCIASISKMPFNKGMPKSAGEWNPKEFPWDEIIDWQNAGYPQGEGAEPPPRDPALDNPQTSFEKTMAEFDLKLKKFRDADRNNETNPSNYLTYGNADAIKEVCAKWDLPSNYVDFLKRFFPYRLNCYPILKYDHYVEFCRPENLIEEQGNWSHYKDTGEPREFWRPEFFVFGNIDGPLMFDLSKSNGVDAPVLSYDYCLDMGECNKEAASFEAFIKKLKVKVR